YFLWPVAESGRSVVKTDYAGHVLWRKTPFLGGGWGPLYALCADGKYVYLARGDSKPQLSRLDARTGQLQTWGTDANAPTERPISDTEAVSVPPDSSPLASSEVFGAAPNVKQPECVGLATDGREVFASVYSQNAVRLFNAQTGLPEREPAQINEIPGARGLALDGKGDLYVVSAPVGGPAQVRKLTVGGNRKWQQSQVQGGPLVTSNLAAPWDVAVAANGYIFVSDLGKSQQIKEFGPDGKLLTAHGRPGGRPWAGKYDPDSFLNPAGIAADAQGGLLVAESSIPKVMSRWDVRTGKALQRWFGGPIYWDGTWPDTDPRTVYYQVNGGFARANLSRPDWPQAYWALGATDTPAAGDFGGVIPTVLVANNGKKYIVGDVSPNGVALMDGDKVLPVAHFLVKNKGRDSALGGERNTTQNNYIEVWQDANGDHKLQPSEVTRLDTVDGKPLPFVADWFAHVSYMAPNGDFYFTTQANSILKIPAAGFQKDGSIRWDLQKAFYVVPSVLPAQGDTSYAGPRGQVGLQTDTAGDIYTALSATTPELTPALRAKLKAEFPAVPETHWGAYETNALREAMHEGLGHTGESNAVKIIKYAPDGHILWMAGRKATAAARPGQMYHFWALAGLVGKPGNEYVAAASEWGPFHVYTHDGFFVDTLMNDPGLNPPPGPYTFGSETGSGRIQYFPQQDQVWAYAVGIAYTVDGFKNGAVEGERRVSGTV
ncbi:MAG: hypothetical protein M3Y28_11315, partial [Armatimonadota bacterium]|nr:hypothetical protein [Armatimonadota bacterium]